MAKEKSVDKEERRREKHAKKEKRSEKDGVHKSKKDKKEKNKQEAIINSEANKIEVTTELLNKLEEEKPGSIAVKEDENIEIKVKAAPLLGALVPFANPLADEKVQKKVLKCVKKANKHKTLKRGVKEVVKALRKSPAASASANAAPPPGAVILAADISPMDVISHIPVLCEDHGVPYIFVPSRAELGAAGNTKRPTSVVMVAPAARAGAKKKKAAVDEKEVDEGEFAEVYAELVRVITKASRDVRI